MEYKYGSVVLDIISLFVLFINKFVFWKYCFLLYKFLGRIEVLNKIGNFDFV